MQNKFLAFLAIIAITLAACPANYNINNIVADSVSFTANTQATSPMSLKYKHTFAQSFANAPVVALGVQDFDIKLVAANNFAVYPIALTNSHVQFQFDYSSIWTKIRINFWASNNNQLQLGYFRVDNIEIQKTCNCSVAYANIITPFSQSDNPILRVFINGFDVSTNSIQVSVSPTNLQNTRLTIRITIGSRTKLNKIWLSWLAFSKVTTGFGAFGGQIARSGFSGQQSVDISRTLYQTPYTFYGFNLLSIQGSQQMTFTTNIDDNFVLTVSSSCLVHDFSIIYISIGVLPGQICANCATGSIANDDQCVSSCPSGTYPFTYGDQGIGCRECSSQLGFILSNGRCVKGTVTTTTNTRTTIVTGQAPSTPAPVQTATTMATTTTTTNVPVVTQTRVPTSTVVTPTTPVVVPNRVPTTPVVVPTTPVVVINSPVVSEPTPIPCSQNSFWNGNECVCDVGYIWSNGKCQVINAPKSVPVMIAYPDKKDCPEDTVTPVVNQPPVVTVPNVTVVPRPNTTIIVPNVTVIPRPNTTVIVSNVTVVPKPNPVKCGANAYNNGLGICVCNQNFYFDNNVCVAGSQCGANQQRSSSGLCVCSQGFSDFNGVCSRCPQGALWSSAANRCVFVCGQNAAYSTTAKACLCNPGFGLFNNVCQSCPQNYFISNSYCVTCPINSVYSRVNNRCDCSVGFFTNENGICVRKCGQNEIYNERTQGCGCLSGLGKVGGVCQICPAGSKPTADGSACSSCQANQELVNGKCLCSQGFAYNEARVCTACSSLKNAFIVNNVCSVCPGNLIYNGKSCSCPAGKVVQRSRCISQCQNDELLDNEGNCYSCGNNQVISGGKCVCASGYSLNSCGVCSLACLSNQFIFQGACATCPLNTIYNSDINSCSCPQGFYMDTYGICQKLVLNPITCPDGQYFDTEKGCQRCSATCKTCRAATECVTCAEAGYIANAQGSCSPVCGDGIIVAGQSCDTGSVSSLGCVGCRIQPNWLCTGQPSTCRSTSPTPAPTPTPTPTPTPVNPTADPLVQVGTASINSNNVFITLKTNPTFTFSNPTEMQSFLKATFATQPRPTVYCAQRNAPNLDTFDCLLIYPSGVPNKRFNVDFAFNYQGRTGRRTVTVDPLTASNARQANKSNNG